MSKIQLQELFSLIKNKKFRQAIIELNNFLKQSPDHLDCLNLLGVAHSQLGDFYNAKKVFEKAVSHYCDHFQSQLNLAMCQVQLQDFNDAKATLLKCNALESDHPDVLNALGNIYRIEGKLREAELMLKRAYSINPKNPAIFENLAWLALKNGDLAIALRQFAQLNKAFPKNTSVALGLAECQIKQATPSKAEHILMDLLEQHPQHAEAHLLISTIYHRRHFSKRLYHLQQAIKFNPKLSSAQFQLALAYQEMGDEIQSTKHFETVLKLKRTCFEAYFHLAYKRDYQFTNSQKDQLIILCTTHKHAQELYWLYFSLAKIEDKRRDYQQAFIYLKKARQLFSTCSSTKSEITRPFVELINTKATICRDSRTSRQLIFVTGMPRSGTTLTDQILDCHSAVHSIGESGIVSQLAYRVEQKTKCPYYKGVEQLSSYEKSDLVNQLLEERQLTSHSSIVDTSPNNIFYVGFIFSLIPNSKIIFCKRSPLDTCLSIYQYPLKQQNYANDLVKLGAFYQQSTQLIEYWEEIFPELTTTVFYEHLTSSPEKTIKKLLSELGLFFELSCLNPENNKRHVLTPSSEQVRKPINKKAIGKWKKFSPYIEELTTILIDFENVYQQRLEDLE